MNLDRKIRLFLVTYGRLLFMIFGIIVVFIYILQNVNNFVKKQNIQKEANKKIMMQKIKLENEDKKIISKFIYYCILKSEDNAYYMLSEKCKNEKYTTKEEFKKKYLDELIKNRICKYEIENEKDFYIVNLTEDMLITGKTNSIKQTKIQVENNKIYIYK